MLSRQKSYMKPTEDDTLELVEELDAKKVFIKSMPEATQQHICKQYNYTKECIRHHGSEHKISLDQLRSLAEDLITIRHFTSAATILDRTCLGCKRCYGQTHVNVALVLSRQAFALSSDRKFDAAAECYEKSLLLLEDLYDFRVYYNPSRRKSEPHSANIVMIPTIAVPIIDGLGYTLGMLLRHRESEFCHRTLLHYYVADGIDRTREPYLPVDPTIPIDKQHPEALKAINKLAKALQAQGKFAEAEELCGDSLDDSVQTLGANHPTTQTCVVTMAQLKHSQGKVQEAEVMYRRSLACNEEVLGLTHSETLANVMLLAGLRAEQKDYRGAETLYLRALAGYEATLGRHHSSTIDAVHNVGAMLLKQQRPTQALPYLDRALEERTAYYGDTHPATLATLFCVGKAHHLESLWKHRTDYHELVETSLRILRTALAGTDGVHGPDSPQSVEICEYLAEVLLQCNRFSAAIPYSRRVYEYYHHSDGSIGRGGPVGLKSPLRSAGKPSRSGTSANNSQADPGVGGIKIIYGPLHRRTAEAAYQLATLLENSSDASGASDAAKHIEAANLFQQAQEGYRVLLERCRGDADYCERNATRRRHEYNYDSAEGKVPDDELSIEEIEELVADALEQHQHALRRSQL